jgi:hypothetical protein
MIHPELTPKPYEFNIIIFAGVVVYFYYGIKHSTLEGDPFDGNIELHTTGLGEAPADSGGATGAGGTTTAKAAPKADAGWSATSHQYSAELAPASSAPRAPHLFVSPNQFPSWDEE